MIPKAVLRVVGEVRVTGAILLPELVVVPALGVRVSDQDRDGWCRWSALEHPGKNFGLVGLLALGREPALARPAAVELHAEIIDRQLKPRRAAVDDHHVGWAVGFARRGDDEMPARSCFPPSAARV